MSWAYRKKSKTVDKIADPKILGGNREPIFIVAEFEGRKSIYSYVIQLYDRDDMHA